MTDHCCAKYLQQPLGRSMLLSILSQRHIMKISIHHLQQLKKHWFRVTTQPPAMETNHFSSPNAHTYNLESLLRCRLCPISPGWGLRVCISNKAQDDAEADGPATTL